MYEKNHAQIFTAEKSDSIDKIKVQFRDINQAYETLKEKRKIGEHDEDDHGDH